MTKPPVKLGVGKKFLEKRKEPPSGKMKLVWQPQHFNIGGSMSMNDVKSLSHSKWMNRPLNVRPKILTLRRSVFLWQNIALHLN